MAGLTKNNPVTQKTGFISSIEIRISKNCLVL